MKKVTLYTLSTCPWCRKAKKFFAERDIPFTYIDYDLADDSTQERFSGARCRRRHGLPVARSATRSSRAIGRISMRVPSNHRRH